jgi:hypothetical protein
MFVYFEGLSRNQAASGVLGLCSKEFSLANAGFKHHQLALIGAPRCPGGLKLSKVKLRGALE